MRVDYGTDAQEIFFQILGVFKLIIECYGLKWWREGVRIRGRKGSKGILLVLNNLFICLFNYATEHPVGHIVWLIYGSQYMYTFITYTYTQVIIHVRPPPPD